MQRPVDIPAAVWRSIGAYARYYGSAYPGCGYDDMLQVGVVAYLESQARYDATQGVPLESYARHRIRGAMLDHLRADVRSRGPWRLPLRPEPGGHPDALLCQLVARLPPRDQALVWGLYALGATQAELAQRLALTPGRVTQLRNAILARLRRKILARQGSVGVY